MKYKEVRNLAIGKGTSDPFAAVFLDQALIAKIVALCQSYLARFDCDSTSILGFLLHGQPGQGKSYFLQMLAVALNRDLCYLPLGSGSMDDTDLIKAFANAPPNSIFLMEDIDNVDAALTSEEIRARKGSTARVGSSTKQITAGALLNVLSGPLCKVLVLLLALALPFFL